MAFVYWVEIPRNRTQWDTNNGVFMNEMNANYKLSYNAVMVCHLHMNICVLKPRGHPQRNRQSLYFVKFFR